MHNKVSETIDIDHGNRSVRKSKSASNLSAVSKKKTNNISSMKIEADVDNKPEASKSSPIGHKINGNTSPNQRRRPKRTSINNNAFLSTVASVHELMSFVVYKDNPPPWLKQTDLYKEYKTKSEQTNVENISSTSPPHFHQQVHRKQRCNLHLYARSDHSWQPSFSPPLISPSNDNQPNESMRKAKRESNISSLHASSSPSRLDLSIPLSISVKSETIEQTAHSTPNKSKSSKQSNATVTTRRQHMLCKKKIPQNGTSRHERTHSVDDYESLDKKESSSSSSSQHDSNTSTSSASSSSIEHTSPSPTTTISGSSSHRSSPTEYMRGNGSINTRLSSPLRIQTSVSPHFDSLSTPQRRSARLWVPSNFYMNPMWILPSGGSSKRLLVQNESSPPSPPSESNSKRPRRRCRS